MKLIKKRISITLIIASLTVPGAAFAAASSGHVTREHSQTRSYLSKIIDTAEKSIVRALNTNHRDLLANLRIIAKDSATAQMTQAAQAAKAQSQSAVELQRAAEKRQAEKARPQLTCDFGSSANAPSSGGNLTAQRSGGSGTNWEPQHLSDELKQALASADQTAQSAPPLPDRDYQRRLLSLGGCKSFAAPGTERFRICEQMGLTQAGHLAAQLPNGDVDGAILFSGTTKPGRKVLSVPADSPNRDARNTYITRLIDPVPLRQLTNEAMQTAQGQAYAGDLENFNARKSLGEVAVKELDAYTSAPALEDKTTRDANHAAITLMLENEDTAEFVKAYLQTAGINGGALSYGDLSAFELMNIEIERRAGNSAWVKKMAGSDTDEKLSELLFLEAQNSRLHLQAVHELKKNNALMGQIVVLLNEPLKDKLEKRSDALAEVESIALQPEAGGSNDS